MIEHRLFGVGHGFVHPETEFFGTPLGIGDFEAKKLGFWTTRRPTPIFII